ncbi:MAG: TetR/AcrR family transcriptional regulator [Candidatus Lernaella stagnicola]|nr:TetR/AcrR family transcriptional regulator [Candidatus Lernaella stagnicola]
MKREKRDQERKAKTRRRLLDAAATVFVEHGYHATLISQIVAEARVGQGTFYRYFHDKRHIFAELLEDFFGTLLAQFDAMSQRLPQDAAEYREASLQAIWTAADILDDHIALARLFIREGPSIDREFAQRMEDVYATFAGVAAALLEHAIEQGFGRPSDAKIVGQCLVGMTLRLIDSAWGEGALQHVDKKEMIKQAVDFAFHGIGVFPPTSGRSGAALS